MNQRLFWLQNPSVLQVLLTFLAFVAEREHLELATAGGSDGGTTGAFVPLPATSRRPSAKNSTIVNATPAVWPDSNCRVSTN